MHGEMRQVAHDVGIAKLARVTLVVKQNEVPRPVDVGILRAQGVVLEPDGSAQLVEEFGRDPGRPDRRTRLGSVGAARD